MSAAEGQIPPRCQDCYRFTDALSEIQALTAEADLINSTRYHLEGSFSPENIDFRLSTIAFRLVEVRLQLESDTFYSVGCPGVDLSHTISTNEEVLHTKCQSPFRRV